MSATLFRPLAWTVFLSMGSARGSPLWLKGDLHSHSQFSDGAAPVADVVATAEARRLDFFALTDHDSRMGGVPLHWSSPSLASATTLLLYGIEWTSAQGHANIWASHPFAYDDFWVANQNLDLDLALQAAAKTGALFSVNHPAAIRGLDWRFPWDSRLGHVEVWNSSYRYPTVRNSRGASGVWDELLATGRKVVGVGGSDTHSIRGPLSHLFNVGNPTTWVLAGERTQDAVLEGLRSGQVSVSCDPEAPRLELEADGDGDGRFETLMGQTLPPGSQTVRFRARVVATSQQWRGSKEWRLNLIRNGIHAGSLTLHNDVLEFDEDARQLVYLRVVLLDPLPRMRRLSHCARTVAMSNPIYGGRQEFIP